ncbi:hypothetical protein T11_16676 [Trichinella zimbabwensis]|uniref:Uncharacterized protein n=1 Tax=Trichinella zimbabwensis TaxID=268475 RepID=A0A0V1GZ17_9BILA|nr:hypothetical protein T11_16676 [Trichinella zimbabwensis]
MSWLYYSHQQRHHVCSKLQLNADDIKWDLQPDVQSNLFTTLIPIAFVRFINKRTARAAGSSSKKDARKNGPRTTVPCSQTGLIASASRIRLTSKLRRLYLQKYASDKRCTVAPDIKVLFNLARDTSEMLLQNVHHSGCFLLYYHWRSYNFGNFEFLKYRVACEGR